MFAAPTILAAFRYRRFKLAIFALLAANAVIFALFGRATEALDSFAWFVLLALFELETAYPQRMRGSRLAILVHAARAIAGVAVAVAAIGFVHEREWLDAANSALWIGVVLVLEFEVRYLETFERHRTFLAATAGALYTGMAALVPIWAWRGEWFDAYDAALWLTAFVTIEINLLRIARAAGAPDAVPSPTIPLPPREG